jgi:hypothetical protein
MAAGVGYKISPTGFLALKALLALIGVFVGAMLGAGKGVSGLILGGLMSGALGFLGPDYALTLKARGRKEKIRADLPTRSTCSRSASRPVSGSTPRLPSSASTWRARWPTSSGSRSPRCGSARAAPRL